MKNLKFTFKSIVQSKARWLLTLIAILTLGVGQMWADDRVNGGDVYFDAGGSGWSVDNVQYVVGHSGYSTGYSMTAVQNTLLYYYSSPNWDDASYFAFASGTSEWGAANQAWSARCEWATISTTEKGSYDLNSGNVYVFKSNGTDKCESVESDSPYGWLGNSGYSDLNKTITVAAQVSTDGGANYSNASSPGTLTASSYSFTAHGNNCKNSTSLSDGEIICGYTANTTLTAGSATGYTIAGWYDSDGSKLCNNGGTINPRADATVYAYYTLNQYTVSYGVNSSTRNGSITLNSGSSVSTTSSSTLNHGTSISFTASPSTGYQVEGWYSDADCSSNKKLQSGGTSYSAGTLTAAITVYVKFETRTGGTVTLSAGTGGQVSLDGSSWGSSKAKSSITTATAFNIYAQANTGYSFSSWAKSSGSGTISSTSSASTSFTPVAYEDATVTASFSEVTVTVSPTCAYDHGDPSYSNPTASNSGTVGIVSESELVAPSAGTGYTFAGWTLSSNLVVTSGNAATDRTITVRTNGDGEDVSATANYNEVLTTGWKIIGQSADNAPFSSWTYVSSTNTMAKASGHSTESVVYATVTVAAASVTGNSYEFKVTGDGSTLYGYGTNGDDHILFDQTKTDQTVYSNSNNDHALRFKPNVAGNYTFKVDYSGTYPQVSVTFPTSYTLTYSIGDVAGNDGDISSSPSTSSGSKVLSSSTVTLTAPEAADGYTWKGWYANSDGSGDQLEDDAEYAVTVSANTTVYACYTENKYTVAFNNGDHGTVSPSGDQQVGVSGVEITATPSGGYKFDHWSKTGDGVTLSSTTANPTTVTASGTGSVTANYAERYILLGSIDDKDDTKGGMAGWTATSNSSYTSWSFVGNVLTIRANLTSGDTKYKFQIVDKESGTWHGQTGDGTITASSKWTLDGGNDVFLQTTDAGNYTFVFDFSKGSNPEVSIAYPGEFICGDFTNWGEGQDNIAFDDNGEATVELEEGDYEFKIIYANEWYGNGATIDGTTLDQTLTTSGANCTISVPEDGDTYLFAWDANNDKLSVFTSADAAKAKLTKNKYVYCDARGNSGWKEADFDARFWFKNFCSGADFDPVTCNKTKALQNWVFYAQVPNSDFVGRVQMNRLNPSNHSDIWTTSSVIQAYTRSSANQNCMVVNTSDNGLTWGTYCPPMKTVALEDNSTVTYGGNGSKATPYLVEKGGTIKLQAHTTKYIDDANMTPKFLFFDAATKKVDQPDSAYNYTANASADVVHKMVVKTYNTYNSVNGDTIEITDTVYYKTVTCYNVTYSAPTNGNYTISVAGGSASSATKKAIAGQTITLAATPSNQAYTFKAWTVTKASSGTVTVTDNTFTMPSEGVTVTAEFEPRYALMGSRNTEEGETEGMPGWTPKDILPDFTVNSVGTPDGSGNVTTDLTCVRTLLPNRSYKFEVYDRKDKVLRSTSASEEQVTLAADASLQLTSTWDDVNYPSTNTNKDVLIYTVGYGTYTFKITAISAEGYPTITVERQASYVLNMGCTDNGSVSAQTTEGGNNFTITDGQYVASGGTITFTASPNVGYALDGWYSSDAYSDEPFMTANPSSINDITATVNVYAKFVPVTLTFNATTDATWNTESNWSPAKVPTIEHDVVLAKPVTVNVANAKAKSVLIDQYSGNTGKLTIAAGKALAVATSIKKKDATSGDETTITEETDIIIESDGSNGTGALVAGSASTTTNATVQFYSKAKYYDSKYINQYFGIPMDSVSKLNYYGSYLRKYDQPSNKWVSFTENKLGPWTAYRIMREETSEGTYQVGGTLLLPGTGATKTLTLNTSSHYNDNMFANSWTAPIDITKFNTSTDFVGATATIYIFNAGSSNGAAVEKGAAPGNWNSLPVSATMAVPGDYDLNVIPSQQAFLVQATSESGEHSLKLDYERLVYNPIVTNGATITPTRAPRRAEDNDLEIVRLFMTGESGLGDRVLMYVRDDFSADEMDNGWEAYKLSGSAFAPQLCAYSGLGEMSISATNVIEGTVLGFYAGTEDSKYTFTFDYEGDQYWYLNDLEAQQSTLISAESSYEFSAEPGTVAARRFVISRSPIAHTPTGIDNSGTAEGTQARKQMINGILYIIRGGQIYSADGQLVK